MLYGATHNLVAAKIKIEEGGKNVFIISWDNFFFPSSLTLRAGPIFLHYMVGNNHLVYNYDPR